MCNKQSPNGALMYLPKSLLLSQRTSQITSTYLCIITAPTSNLYNTIFIKKIDFQLWPHQINAFKFQEWCQFFNQIIKRIKREFIMHHLFSISHFWWSAPYSGFYLFPMKFLFCFYSKHLKRMVFFSLTKYTKLAKPQTLKMMHLDITIF